MKSYSDVEFAELVNDKVGNVAEFKKALRKYGLISKRKQLTDEYIDLFNEAQKLQSTDSTWLDAFDTVLQPLAKNINDDNDKNTDILERIADNIEMMNQILLRLEKKLQ